MKGPLFPIVFDFDDVDHVALLDEEIRAELAALGVFALFPCILDDVIPLGALLPRRRASGVLPFAHLANEFELGPGIRNRHVAWRF